MTPRTTIGTAWLKTTGRGAGLASTFAGSTPYCHASFIFETFVELI
jgi:hypothetical protein